MSPKKAADRIRSKDDPEAARVVEQSLRQDGVEFLCGATVTRVEHSGEQRVIYYTQNGGTESIVVDQLLVSVGRTPNVEGLGLDAAGVRYDGRNGIGVDDRLRTSNPRIFAVGDIASRYQFTHAADAQARLVVRNARFFGRGRASELVIPWCTYTSPALAHVGISADEVRERGGEVDTLTVSLEENDRAHLDGATDGFLRIHLRSGSDEILGATLVAERAGEIISQLTQAMTLGIGLGRLGEVTYPYPTHAEVSRKAADQWRRRKLTPFSRRVFGLFFRVLR